MFYSYFEEFEVVFVMQKGSQILFFQTDFKFMLDFNFQRWCLAFNLLRLQLFGIFVNFIKYVDFITHYYLLFFVFSINNTPLIFMSSIFFFLKYLLYFKFVLTLKK